jgi:hypothetical protein
MASNDVKASGAPMHAMLASRRYRKCAAECARLARTAPSPRTRESFSSAAKSWLILAALDESSTLTNNIGLANELGGDDSGEAQDKQIPHSQLR